MNFDLATAAGSRAVIVVEGMSDRVALETLAERRGIALRAQGISIVHLDGATNIGRFLDLLRSYSERAQFIVVTHQKRTMEAADCLYGVSMGSDGISKVISRRLPEERAAA